MKDMYLAVVVFLAVLSIIAICMTCYMLGRNSVDPIIKTKIERKVVPEWFYTNEEGWKHIWKYPENNHTYYINGVQYEPFGVDSITVPCDTYSFEKGNKYGANPTEIDETIGEK